MKRSGYLIVFLLVAVMITGCTVSVSSPGSLVGYVYIPKGYLAGQSVSELEPLFLAQASPPSNDYEPLVGARIQVVGRTETVTDRDGYFEIRGLPPGKYTITVNHPNIREVIKSVYIAGGTTTWLGYDNAGVAYYIVIGIDLYSGQSPIYGPYNDAIAVYEELYERNRLAGRARLLIQEDIVNPLTEPTRENIENAIRYVVEELSTSENDYLVIYFSGDSARNQIRPSDDVSGEKRITDGQLESWVREFRGHVTLIIDGHDSETMADKEILGQAFEKPNYTVLGSTLDGQEAGAHKDRIHSWFTYHLLQGITTRAADYNGDRDITASELYRYTYNAMKSDPNQTPFLWPGHSGDAVIFRY